MSVYRQLEIAAAGRIFRPGMLYNVHTDELVDGVFLWEHDPEKQYVTTDATKPKTYYCLEDTYEKRAEALGFDGELGLKIMSGIVKVSGSAEYFSTSKSSCHVERASVVIRYTSKKVEFNPGGPAKIPDNWQPGLATHYVSSVTYGGNCVFILEAESKKEDQSHKGKGELKAELSECAKLLGTAVDGKSEVVENWWKIRRNKTPKDFKNIHFGFMCDCAIPDIPSTFQEAVSVVKKLPNYVKDTSCAIRVTLLPLPTSLLKEETSVKSQPRIGSPSLVKEVLKCMDAFDHALATCDSLTEMQYISNLKSARNQFETFRESVLQKKTQFLKNIADVLTATDVEKKSSGSDEEPLRHHLDSIQGSAFAPECILPWIQDRESEADVLMHNFKKLEKFGVRMVFSESELDSFVAKSAEPGTYIIIRVTYPLLVGEISGNADESSDTSTYESVKESRRKNSSEGRTRFITKVQKDFGEILKDLEDFRDLLRGKVLLTESKEAPGHEINLGFSLFKLGQYDIKMNGVLPRFCFHVPPLEQVRFKNPCTGAEGAGLQTIVRSMSSFGDASQSLLRRLSALPKKKENISASECKGGFCIGCNKSADQFCAKACHHRKLCAVQFSRDPQPECGCLSSKESCRANQLIFDEPFLQQMKEFLAGQEICTFYLTGAKKVNPVQHWFNCLTCDLTGEAVCCLVCAIKCHLSHMVMYKGFDPGYCVCGREVEQKPCKAYP